MIKTFGVVFGLLVEQPIASEPRLDRMLFGQATI
jgi:hypothetical protein